MKVNYERMERMCRVRLSVFGAGMTAAVPCFTQSREFATVIESHFKGNSL